ncbi:MAG: polysaccharide deacetylase family protein [Propionibacteriaceae bacterium]
MPTERPAWAGSVTAVRTAAPHLVLTFDDGPEPGGTDKVLAALDDADATATFFILVSRARRFPGLLADVVASRHQIGLHGLDHRRLTQLGPDVVRQRTADAKAELEDLTGRQIDWCRPPYGAQNRETWHALTSCDLVPVLWGPTLQDWLHLSNQERIEHAQLGAEAGSILLAHDGFAGPEDGAHDGPAPVFDRGELVRDLLQRYAERGLVGRSLADALVDGTQLREERFPL